MRKCFVCFRLHGFRRASLRTSICYVARDAACPAPGHAGAEYNADSLIRKNASLPAPPPRAVNPQRIRQRLVVEVQILGPSQLLRPGSGQGHSAFCGAISDQAFFKSEVVNLEMCSVAPGGPPPPLFPATCPCPKTCLHFVFGHLFGQGGLCFGCVLRVCVVLQSIGHARIQGIVRPGRPMHCSPVPEGMELYGRDSMTVEGVRCW